MWDFWVQKYHGVMAYTQRDLYSERGLIYGFVWTLVIWWAYRRGAYIRGVSEVYGREAWVAQAVSALCLLPLKLSLASDVSYERVPAVSLSCASRVFLRVLRFFSLSKINVNRTSEGPSFISIHITVMCHPRKIKTLASLEGQPFSC